MAERNYDNFQTAPNLYETIENRRKKQAIASFFYKSFHRSILLSNSIFFVNPTTRESFFENQNTAIAILALNSIFMMATVPIGRISDRLKKSTSLIQEKLADLEDLPESDLKREEIISRNLTIARSISPKRVRTAKEPKKVLNLKLLQALANYGKDSSKEERLKSLVSALKIAQTRWNLHSQDTLQTTKRRAFAKQIFQEISSRLQTIEKETGLEIHG